MGYNIWFLKQQDQQRVKLVLATIEAIVRFGCTEGFEGFDFLITVDVRAWQAKTDALRFRRADQIGMCAVISEAARLWASFEAFLFLVFAKGSQLIIADDIVARAASPPPCSNCALLCRL